MGSISPTKLNDTTFQLLVNDAVTDRIEVEIGDSKQPDFKPQVKIMRWDNDINFSVRAEENAGAILEQAGDVIKYITTDYEVHQYAKPDASSEGGFEFEWILNKKPVSNILRATIQTKGLEFHYQPALTSQEIVDGAVRPDNVVGSYAVYHATKANYQIDGKNYKSGKAFHIYRPKATDANNAEVWCDINIDEINSLLTITIPQKFLDIATYPVKIDPTFGYTTAGGSGLYSNAAWGHKLAAQQYTASAGDIITKYSVNISTFDSGTFKVIGYTFASGNPSTRLAAALSAAAATGSWAWKDTATVSHALTGGTVYVVAAGERTGTTGIAYDTVTAAVSRNNSGTGLNDPFTNNYNEDYKISMYATYTAGGGGYQAVSLGSKSLGYQPLSKGELSR